MMSLIDPYQPVVHATEAAAIFAPPATGAVADAGIGGGDRRRLDTAKEGRVKGESARALGAHLQGS